MRITIHRGTHEIGGSCVEVASGRTRVIVDLGMPLVHPKDKSQKLDSLPLAAKSKEELLELGVLPPVEGLYDESGEPVTAVLLSHPHQDHYGLVRHIRRDIPVYLSAGAQRIIEASDIFLPTKAQIKTPVTLEHKRPVTIGEVTVTPFAVDHSAFGSMAFLIEAGGRRIFYSGDIRGHGRKGKLFESLLQRPPREVDCLLMEGTTLGRGGHGCETEAQIEDRIVRIARKWEGLKLVYASAQNIDRIVSFYRAAQRLGGVLAVDLYTAYVLDAIETASVPHASPRFSRLKVFYTKLLMRKLLREGMGRLLAKYRPHEISAETIARSPGRVFLMYRDSLQPEVERIGRLDGAVLIYSQYQGYRREPSFRKVSEFLTVNGIGLESAHTSGHAPGRDLARLVKAIAPRELVPIHTFHPGSYDELWHTIRRLEDGFPASV
ncbi:MAG: MBL fold metallo-hydrolase [Elusimicrobia bacterium]|nr:MBL fold metallo-hydrolase [Elusimicrobiota bacterium]